MMKPFSNPTIAKRTYREVKLLKHLRHENVCCWSGSSFPSLLSQANALPHKLIGLSDIFISPSEDV